MQLYLIRHGQSYNNALKDETKRHKDPALTQIGEEQAQRLGEYVGKMDFGITHLYCSAMYRALQTCQPIAQALNMQPQVWVDIHEGGGIFLKDYESGEVTGYGGMTRDEITDCFPDYLLPDNVTDQGWWDVAKGEETLADFISRGIKVGLELRERRTSDAVIALVVHAGFMDVLLKALLNQLPLSPRHMFYRHNNTGITRIDFELKDRIIIDFLNRTEHLPPDMITM